MSIKKNNLPNLNDKLKTIEIYSLKNNSFEFINLDEYKLYRNKYISRLAIFALMIGFILFLNSFYLLNKNQNFMLIGGFAILVLLMRIFNFGIYI